jgi:hypothetical protein
MISLILMEKAVFNNTANYPTGYDIHLLALLQLPIVIE